MGWVQDWLGGCRGVGARWAGLGNGPLDSDRLGEGLAKCQVVVWLAKCWVGRVVDGLAGG